MRKNIGIITLSASDNCGSLLQAYALQYVLEIELECKVDIINLQTKQAAEVYDIIPSQFYKHPKKTIFTLMHIRSILRQKRDYSHFRKQYLNMTEKIYRNVNDLKSIDNKYDVIITGSDQVWNIYMNDYDDAFFIPWKTKSRKIAYAVSLGATLDIDEIKGSQVRRWLKDFDRISVREETGKKTLCSLCDKEIDVLADPTLLLETQTWMNLAGKRMIRNKYIFFYSWSYPDEEMNKLVQHFASEKGLVVYVINSSKWYKYRPQKFDFELYNTSGPITFLNLMLYAEFVFVQSFHGVVFSNLLKKRFFFLNEHSDGTVDFRTANLLRLLHEEEQIVHFPTDIVRAMQTNLTYTSDEYRALKTKSLEYLKSLI